jgi:PAS domain S-box-containing protein
VALNGAPARTATILVVDDLAANRSFLSTILGHEGHRIVEAVNGREGLAVLRAEHPDLVITDVLMPEMDGYELVRQLRLDPATSRIPVVFYTAHYGEREARALALENGVTHVLAKPAAAADVLSIVADALADEPSDQAATAPLTMEFDREHLRLVTDKLSEKAADLRASNARLRALINIGLELEAERDIDTLLNRLCTSARDLFGATYVTLGIVDRDRGTIDQIVACGADTQQWASVGDSVRGLLGAVLAERQTLRGTSRTGDPAGLQFPAGHPNVDAYLAAPIASPAHVYGWICLVANENRTFSEDDEQLIRALAGQVGRIYESRDFHAVAIRRTADLELEAAERGRAEAALRSERDEAQRYLDTAEVILLALDTDGRIALINRKGCELLGWSEAELLGKDWIDTCLPPRVRNDLRQKFGELIRGNFPIGENPILTKSGAERLIEWRNTLSRDAEEHVTGTFSSGTDITERNRALAALEAAEERMRFALQGASVGIWDMDYTTGILRVSETLEAHYGVAPGAFGGTFDAFVERIHPDDRQAVVARIAAAAEYGTDFAIQNRSIWPDGSVRWLNSAGRIVHGADGKPVRGVGISQDVTDQHMREAHYQQAQKMEAIGRLAGGVAHDFNNLLGAILGYCELLLTDLSPGDPRRELAEEIQKAGLTAAGVTRQLLAFSRKQILDPTLVDLNVLVADMRPMLARLIGADVTVRIGLQPNLSSVMADRGQLEQVILNLALNARDAMPDGGTLTIETNDVELDEDYAETHLSVTAGRHVALTVTDTGVGMTPEVQARLFEPFFTTKELGHGTGLGLSIVHGIVERGGGSVNVYSEIGTGTTFRVYFPRADTIADADAPRPRVSPPRAGTQTVLVVEDAENLRALIRRLLEFRGYKVLVAANVEEAMRLFAQHETIDVVLTDVVMPGGSGPELTQKLIAQRPGTKVVYMSGHTEDSIVQRGVLKTGIVFLQKPFTSETLDRKLREVLDQ